MRPEGMETKSKKNQRSGHFSYPESPNKTTLSVCFLGLDTMVDLRRGVNRRRCHALCVPLCWPLYSVAFVYECLLELHKLDLLESLVSVTATRDDRVMTTRRDAMHHASHISDSSCNQAWKLLRSSLAVNWTSHWVNHIPQSYGYTHSQSTLY
jgi:hypothetical protein